MAGHRIAGHLASTTEDQEVATIEETTNTDPRHHHPVVVTDDQIGAMVRREDIMDYPRPLQMADIRFLLSRDMGLMAWTGDGEDHPIHPLVLLLLLQMPMAAIRISLVMVLKARHAGVGNLMIGMRDGVRGTRVTRVMVVGIRILIITSSSGIVARIERGRMVLGGGLRRGRGRGGMGGRGVGVRREGGMGGGMVGVVVGVGEKERGIITIFIVGGRNAGFIVGRRIACCGGEFE